MTARYARGALTETQRLATFTQMRRVLDGKRVIVCKEDIYSDASAPLLEATDTAALLALWPLCQKMAMARPGLGSVRTLTADAVWSGCAEQIFQEGATSFATKRRWRKSF